MRAETFQTKLYSADNWKRRRLFMIGALVFIGFWISYLLWDGKDTQLARDSVSTLIFGGLGILMSYIFGAVADDWDKRKKLDPPPAQDVIPQTDDAAVPPGAAG